MRIVVTFLVLVAVAVAGGMARAAGGFSIASGNHPKGDINCDGFVDPIDSLIILRANAGLVVNLPSGCDPVGSLPNGSTPSATPNPTAAPTSSPTPPPGSVFGDGVWIVGTEVAPGLYRNSDSSGSCYWERLSGFGGSLDEIIANSFDDSIQTVQIMPGDAGFSSERCGTWSTDLHPPSSGPSQPFGDGTWLVGEEIAPGLWRNSDSSGSCYWERLNGFGGRLDDIIDNEFSDSIQTVQISASDVGFSSDRCGTWTKIG